MAGARGAGAAAHRFRRLHCERTDAVGWRVACRDRRLLPVDQCRLDELPGQVGGTGGAEPAADRSAELQRAVGRRLAQRRGRLLSLGQCQRGELSGEMAGTGGAEPAT